MQEMQALTRVDTIFVVSAVIFNFIMLGINSALADTATHGDITATIVLAITLGLSVLLNGTAVFGLLTSRSTRQKYQQGLLKMYGDADVGQYYDETLITNYMRRYVLFITIIGLLGLTSILVPLVILVTTHR